MKNLSILIVIMLFAEACNSDDAERSIITVEDIAEIRANVSSGNWMVSKYIDSGKDQTSDYSGYSFSFNANGSLIVSNLTSTIEGTWSVTNDSSSNDDSSDDNDVDFNIFFQSPELLNEFTDDWDIVSYSSTRIELKDVSGGDGTTDNLIFEKN